MDQKKIGQFLKELRKEKNITQEVLAEKLNVSNRTISRWETGINMPDISLLVELSEFYHVTIPEIINGERKSEKMNQETKDTAVKMAEYSKNEVKTEKKKITSFLLMAFGAFVIISAFAIFPNDSSWGSIYSIIGGIVLIIGFYFKIKSAVIKKSFRILSVIGCILILFGIFTISDYIAVSQYHQVPRFSYEKIYGENQVEHKTLFYTAIQKNPGTENERVEIVTAKVADDEIALRIQLDTKEDIGLIIYDYSVGGIEHSGGIANADKSLINHSELTIQPLCKQPDFDNLSDIEDLTIKFTIITEYVDPNYENIYPEEYTKVIETPISLKAHYGESYSITISGDKKNGYKAVLEA